MMIKSSLCLPNEVLAVSAKNRLLEEPFDELMILNLSNRPSLERARSAPELPVNSRNKLMTEILIFLFFDQMAILPIHKHLGRSVDKRH